MISLYIGIVLALGSLCAADPPLDCSDGQPALLPLNLAAMQGKWNMMAVAVDQEIWAKYWQRINLLWVEVSTEAEHIKFTNFYGSAGLTSMYPFAGMKTSEDETSIKFKDQESSGDIVLAQPCPETLMVTEYYHGHAVGVMYYTKTHEISEKKMDTFKHWMNCKNFKHIQEMKNAIDYASVCPDVLTLEDLPAEGSTEGSWPLVAKASNIPDSRYMVRSLYSAQLDFSLSKKNYAITEFQTIGDQKRTMSRHHPDKEDKPLMDDCTSRVMVFKSSPDTLLLGVEKICKVYMEATLYFSAKAGKVTKSEIEKFKQQALCYSAGYVYLVPGGTQDHDSESHDDDQHHGHDTGSPA